MPKVIRCPFYQYDNKTRINCELKHKKSFANENAKAGYMAMYCAHIKAWNRCNNAIELLKRYGGDEQ
jgi:hypothetical protein